MWSIPHRGYCSSFLSTTFVFHARKHEKDLQSGKCRVCFRPCVFNKFSHFWQNSKPKMCLERQCTTKLERLGAHTRPSALPSPVATVACSKEAICHLASVYCRRLATGPVRYYCRHHSSRHAILSQIPYEIDTAAQTVSPLYCCANSVRRHAAKEKPGEAR